MPIFQLIYRSKANFFLSDNDLITLLRQARENNAEKNITGLLLYGHGNFIQLLEGNEEYVRDLFYTRISKDKRHRNVVVLHQAHAPERQFKNWSMAFHALNLERVRNLKGYLEPQKQSDDGKDLLAPLRLLELMQGFSLTMHGR